MRELPTFPYLLMVEKPILNKYQTLLKLRIIPFNVQGKFQILPSLKLPAKAPENRPGPKRKRESIPTIHFQGLLLLVSERVGK